MISSVGYDGILCIWDINSLFENKHKEGTTNLKPTYKIKVSDGCELEDVSWNKKNGAVLATVGSDSKLYIYDLRADSKSPSQTIGGAHKEKGIMAVDFNPFNYQILATAGKDGTAGLWDMRMLHCRFHVLDCYEIDPDTTVPQEEEKRKDRPELEVNSLRWSNASESIIATGGTDRRVRVWDLSRVGIEQSSLDEMDGPPELLFIHGGHTAPVTDISWNKNQQLVLASASEDNLLQVWQMAGEMYFNNEFFEGDDAQ